MAGLNARARAPFHLWLSGLGSLAFNALGALSYTMTRLGRPSEPGMTPEQIAFMASYPAWANRLWALGVWGALAGSLLLLARSRLAVAAMGLALIGLVGTTVYHCALIKVPPSMRAPLLDAAI